ncbi:ankyrin repeat protein [Metarhizium robertsii]|uniref:Ankyrin repeat protein n=2 Tax=Metarhizium robertsii TaxID=568076 RepID=E9F7I9_METRA|nr:Ankyrin repeat protein [Metarhizium robertsii ARSEF 23]EFY96326.1 Ankyrin repeat protein [Metarhizium robertsii ARSEF 23]EXU98606.1 ankyrin repeat protein [Metarhizium robertsii]
MSPTTSTPDPLDDCRWTISGPLRKLPIETLQAILDLLPARPLLALLYAIPPFERMVGSRHVAHIEEDGISILHLLAATSGKTRALDVAFLYKMLAKSPVDANPICQQRNNPLAHAIFSKNEKATEALLKREEVDANSLFPLLEYQTPLIYAIEREEKRLIDLLLDAEGVNVAKPDLYGRTPLSYAAGKGDLVLTRRLLPRYTDTDIGHIDDDGREAISYAASAGSKEVVELLLSQNGVNANQRDRMNRTPLMCAAAARSKEVVELLLSQDGVDADHEDNYGQTPLSEAVEARNEEVIRLLVNPDLYKGGKDDYCATPLSCAVATGDENIVELLLPRPNVDARTRTSSNQCALIEAARFGSSAVVKLLLSQPGVLADEPDIDGRTPLSFAAAYGRESVARLLLEEYSVRAHSRCRDNRTPLAYAAALGEVEIVNLLLDHVKEEDLEDMDSELLVLLARELPRLLAPKLVHASRTDVNYAGNDGYTALFWASRSGSTPLVELLLSHPNINIDKTFEYFNTPLLEAIQQGHEDIALLLIKRGAHCERGPTRLRDEPETPLRAAIRWERERVVEQILHLGVSMETEDPLYELPLVYAIENKNPRIVKLLLDYYSKKTDEATSDLRVGLHRAVTSEQPQAVQMLLGLLNGRVPKPEGFLLGELPMLSCLLGTRFPCMLHYRTDSHSMRCSDAQKLVVRTMLGIKDEELTNMDKKSPFYIALRCQVFVAQMLLDRADGGPDWDRYHFPWPKSRSAFAKYENIVSKLLDMRDKQTAQLRRDNLTVLPWAAADPELESYFNIVWYLLHAPEPVVNIVDVIGFTELLYALGVNFDEDMTWLYMYDEQNP